jgi:hypothetical protein
MPVSAAAGYPQHDGTYVPNSTWSQRLLARYYRSTVWQAIANTDYESEIQGIGSKVIIRTTPTIIIQDVSKGQELDFQNPTTSTVEVEIDKAKAFAYNIDDIDNWQSDLDLQNEWNAAASFHLNIAVDDDVLGYVTPLANASNKGSSAGKDSGNYDLGTTGAPLGLTEDNVVPMLADAYTVLDEQNVPPEGRYMVVPPWFVGLLRKSKLEDASLTNGQSTIRNGRLGILHGFTLYASRSLTTVADGGVNATSILFGHMDALTFAGDLMKTSGPYEAEKSFVHRVKGLLVYGRKVIKDEALGEIYAYRQV